jgi:hypothetical protein
MSEEQKELFVDNEDKTRLRVIPWLFGAIIVGVLAVVAFIWLV